MFMKKCMWLFTFLMMFAVLFSHPAPVESCIDVDIILKNGKIFTTLDQPLIEGSVVINGRFIIDVGTDQEMASKYESSNTIDLQGKIVLPAFNDAHTHLLPYYDPVNGMFVNDPTEWIPDPGPGVYETLMYLQYLDQNPYTPPGKAFYMIVGEGFIDDPILKTVAIRDLIDFFVPNRDVAIYGWPPNVLKFQIFEYC